MKSTRHPCHKIYNNGIEVGSIASTGSLSITIEDGIYKIEISKCIIEKDKLSIEGFDIYVMSCDDKPIIIYKNCKFNCQSAELKQEGLIFMYQVTAETKDREVIK